MRCDLTTYALLFAPERPDNIFPSPTEENENMATHSSRGGSETQIPPSQKLKKKTDRRRWCSVSGFDLIAAQTRHACTVVLPCVLFY